MKTHIFITPIIAAFFFSSCEKTIDASTSDKMKESIIELTKDMSEEERNTILAELAIIAINVEGDEKAFLDCINGMTLSEVKAYSEKIKKEAKRKFDKNLYQIH